MMKRILILLMLLTPLALWRGVVGEARAQAPGPTPVKVSQEKQMMQGRKYYVHIVEKGQTVYSIAKAYRVQSYDAVTHVDVHSLHPGDTVWLPFRGQFADIEEPAAAAPAPTPAHVNTVYVHDTIIVTDTVTLTKTEYVPVHDTTYIDVPVHDTIFVAVRDTTYIDVLHTVHDTTYINVPYTVYDTTIITDTVTQTKTETVLVYDTTYIAVRDTTYIDVLHTVHDTTIVTLTDTVTLTNTVTLTDTVKLTEYVPMHDTTYIAVRDTTYINVHDTTYVDVPYTVQNTTIVTDTVKLTEYVPVHDTTIVTLTNTVTLTDTVKLTEYVPVHDTTYIAVRDTTYINVHDTTYVDVPHTVQNTTFITDTVRLTEYVPVHDTAIVTLTDTVRLTEYVPVHDTTIVTLTDTVTLTNTITLTDTVKLTEYVPVHDTTYIAVHDTTYIDVPHTVQNTTIVTDTVRLTEYVPVHDTTIVTLTDTITLTNIVTLTDTVRLTEYVQVHDTTIVTLTDTVKLTLTEYVPVHDTTYIAVHDTTFVTDTVEVTLAPASDLAFASTSAVPLTDYLPASQPATSLDSPTTTTSERQTGKILKVALMMPLHLDQIDQISTSKFDIEQRGKKSYRQFEFIEFYEGVLLALDKLAEQGISVQLNVVDVSANTPAQVEAAFVSHNVAQSDFIVALLLRDCFDKAAELAQQAGVYIVNPMATRSELCAENPYMVKIQPSLQGMITLMLNNMKVERPDGHLYIIHSNSKAEKPAMDELKRQLTERGDIKYTIFNWSQSAKLASVMKATPKCNVVSIYDQDKYNNRLYCINLLNRLSSIKKDSPTLYTLNDWTREYGDIDFAQLQLLNYHTYSLGWDMTNDVHVQFLQAFRNRFGSEPTSQLAATGHDLMLYIVGGLSRRSSEFWRTPGNSLPTLIQPLHLSRNVAGLENDKAQLYRMEELRFVKALFK